VPIPALRRVVAPDLRIVPHVEMLFAGGERA
jgi:hypothetical protein